MNGSQTVRKRCLLLLGGYEPIPPERQHYRFKRELQRFEKTWSVKSEASDIALSDDGHVASWRVAASGPNWRVETDYVLLRWDDMVAVDFKRSTAQRFARGIAALMDFIVSGAARRYFQLNWRYGVFFIYPLMLLTAFALLSILAGYGWSRLALPFSPVLAPLLAIGLFLVLVRWPGRPMYLAYIIDDWIFARELVRRDRPGLDARLDRFAAELEARMRDAQYDEVVFAAHSLGGAMQPEIVDRVFRRDPDIGRGRGLNLLSVGSSLLKIGLHPAARWLREAVARVSSHAAIIWVEYQARADIINFFNVDPIAAMQLPRTGKPIVQNARIRNMLEIATYRRFQLDFFRLHRQLGMANDRRYFYDFFMICCGPVPIEARAKNPDAMVALFGADGGYLAPAADNEKAVAGKA